MSILDLVDLEATDRAVAAHEATKQAERLPLAVETEARAAAQRAWHGTLATGKTREEATTAAGAAFEAKAVELLSAAPTAPAITTPPVDRPSLARAIPRAAEAVADVAPGVVDSEGAARATAAMAAAEASGFAVAAPLYDVGSRVNALGVKNARRERAAYDAKPLIGAAMDALVGRVRSENRRDVFAYASDVRMTDDGEIDLPGGRYAIGRDAFGDLCTRLGFGGGGYLANCPPDLRAFNVNHHRGIAAAHEERNEASIAHLRTLDARIAALTGKSPPALDRGRDSIKLRVRDHGDGAEVFAAVGPSYAAFDVDRVAEAVALASPSDARGAVQYDAATSRTRIDVLFHSDVRPEAFVAGEVWKAGIQVRTDDTGGGSLRVDAVVFQNLCLNLIIVNRMAQPIARIRHIGSVRELARRFRTALAEAQDKLGAFIRAWGYGSAEDVIARIAATTADVPRDPREALPGIFNGILSAEKVKIPGARDRAIAALVAAWEFDDSSARMSPEAQRVGGVTRTAIINAFTRVAHTLAFDDPFADDEIQRDAGSLLWASRGDVPAALPYEPVIVTAKRVAA